MSDIELQELQQLVNDAEIIAPIEVEHQLTTDQQNCLEWFENILNSQNINDPSIATLQGSAGTGKTYIVCELIKKALAKHKGWYRVGVMAPTNKAVAVLASKLVDAGFMLDYQIFNDDGKPYNPNRVYVGTIHKFLRAIPNSSSDLDPSDEDLQFDFSAEKEEMPINRMNLVIIDEGSMIQDTFFEMIKRSVEPNTIVIFVGDKFQLFPVDNTYAVAQPFTSVDEVFELKEVVRYSGKILEIATILRDNMADGLLSRPYSFRRYELDDLTVIKNKNGYNGTEWYNRLLNRCIEQKDDQLHADYVRALVYKRNTRELLNSQIRLDLYGHDSDNAFIDGEWLFTHSVCHSYIPLEKRIEVIRLRDSGNDSYTELQNELSEQIIRIGNAKDLKVLSNQTLEVAIPSPSEDLDEWWPELTQSYTLIESKLAGLTIDVAVLTSGQLAQFARNKQIILRKLKEIGYSSQVVTQFLRQYGAAFNVTEQPVKFSKEEEKQYSYHNLGLTGFPSQVRVSSKIQPGFVLTVHQSQGSTIDHAFIMYSDYFTYHPEVTEDDRNSLLYRLLYTGLTRAKQTATVFSKY